MEQESTLQMVRQSCLDSFRVVRTVMATPEELAAEAAEQERIRERERAAAAMSAANAAAVAAAMEAAQEIENARSANNFDDSPTTNSSRVRTESTASASGRARNLSMSSSKPRRNSSIFIRLPELSGTSLIRKSSDMFSANQALNNNNNMSVNMSTMVEGYNEDGSNNNSMIQEGMHEHIGSSGDEHDHSVLGGGGAAGAGGENNMDISMMVSVDAMNNSGIGGGFGGGHVLHPLHEDEEVCDTSSVALFEHFIVVGASEDVS